MAAGVGGSVVLSAPGVGFAGCNAKSWLRLRVAQAVWGSVS